MRHPYNGSWKVTSPVGYRTLNGVRGIHTGIDCVGLTDKYVRAVCSGKVVQSRIVTDKSNATWQWGNYIAITGKDGYTVYYCHLSRRIAKIGDDIEEGDIIGVEGNTGYSFGSHCHIELRRGSQKCSPDDEFSYCNIADYIGIPNEAGSYDYTEEEYAVIDMDNTPSEWAEDAVSWATENGIMYGDENGDLKLHDPVTREQMIVFLYRLYEKLKEN